METIYNGVSYVSRIAPLSLGELNSRGIFIVGPSRSGTTLLRLLLNNHSELACLGETHFFHNRYLRLSRDHERNRKKTADIWRNVLSNESAQPDLLARKEVIERVSRSPSVAIYFDAVLSSYAKAEGKKHWAEKSPSHVLRMKLLKRLYPDAKFVLIRRDPYSTCISQIVNLRGVRKSTRRVYASIRYLALVDRLATEINTDHPNSLVSVSYEQLVQNPKKTLRLIFQFLGISDDDLQNPGFFKITEFPKSKDGAPQAHHARLGGSLEEKRYQPKSFFSGFELYLFRKELEKTNLFADYLHEESPNAWYWVKWRLAQLEYLFSGYLGRMARRCKKVLNAHAKRMLE